MPRVTINGRAAFVFPGEIAALRRAGLDVGPAPIRRKTMRPTTKAPTLHDLRRVAGRLVEVVDDVDCGCYRATAADGYAFDDGTLHELIADYSFDETPARKREARRDLHGRLVEYRDRVNGSDVVEPCVDPACGSCRGGRS